MHWLEKWRKDHQMSREKLAEQVGVSEVLIWILENQQGGITHPLIANDIADYTGATPEQRDSIVHKKHRGTYKPNPRAKRFKQKPLTVRPEKPAGDKAYRRAVVAVNPGAVEVDRYPSIAAAAEAMSCLQMTVTNRCARKISLRTNEFQTYGVTFRYADEWDMMPEWLRKDDMKRAEGGKHACGKQMKDVI